MLGADLFVLAAYFLTMVAVGLVYSQQKSCDMYFAGGKQLGWCLGGISSFLSNVSALSIVVYSGIGYEYGLVSLTLYWVAVPATLLSTWLFALRWRRAGIITPTEFLQFRFSPATCQVFVWSGIPLRIIDEGLKIVAIGVLVSGGLNLSPIMSMTVVGLTILVYSVLGGLWAVVVTVLVQFVLVTGALIILLPLSYHAVGEWHYFASVAPSGFFSPVNGPYSWFYIFAFQVLSIMSSMGNWSMIQKFYSARSDVDARRMGWFATLLFLLMPPLWICTGMLARGFIAPNGVDPQTIYGRVAVALLPAGMMGLILAALFAPTMSVLSNGYNVIASILTVDVYRRAIRPQASQHELVVVGRVLTGVVAVIVLAIALVVTSFHWRIFNTMVAAFGLFLPPTVLPVVAGLISRRLSVRGAMAGFYVGMALGLGLLLYKWLMAPANPNGFQAAIILIATGVTLLVLVVAAIWFPATGDAAERNSKFFANLARPSAAVEPTVTSPTPIAGVVILTMGLVLIIVGLGPFPATRLNFITTSSGAAFSIVGAALVLPHWLGQRARERRNTE